MKNNLVGKILILFVVFFVFMGATGIAKQSKQRVFDDANLLTEDGIKRLEEIAEESSHHRETDFIILTTDDTSGKYAREYMQDIYDEKEFGYDKPHGNTAILVIDMSGRDVYLAGFDKAKQLLDDHRINLIHDKIDPDLSAGNYFKAFESFITTADKYMGYKPGVNPENILFKWWFQVALSLVIASVVISTMIYNSGGKVTTNAGTYRDSNRSRIIKKRDRYLRKTVTKRKKPKPSNNRSGRGGGSSGGGMTRGGHSHSGSGRKF